MNLIYFQIDQDILRFHQFGAQVVLDAKHWHHPFDLLQKTIESKKL